MRVLTDTHILLWVRHLPPHHRDPFDRLLIAQAQTEPLLLMTDDPLISLYPVQRIGVHP